MFLVALNKILRDTGWFKKNRINEPNILNFLDLVSLGTVCDVVPLIGLNRAFVFQGLRILSRRQNIGLKMLSDISLLSKKPDEEDLGFFFGPRINAGGRVGKSDIGEKLFTWFGSVGLLALRPNGDTVILGFPVSVIWFIVLLFLATWLLIKTRFGNWIFASGGDANGARNAGVPVTFVKTILFIGTACAATAYATIQVIDAGSADTARGLLKEFEAIIASVVGGCLLHGGYGSAIGAGLGAIIFGTVSMGIYYTGVDSDWFKVFLGIMVLIAVLVNNFIRKRVTEKR